MIFAGEGHYTLALVATKAKGDEFHADPVEVTATCGKSRFPMLKFSVRQVPVGEVVKWLENSR